MKKIFSNGNSETRHSAESTIPPIDIPQQWCKHLWSRPLTFRPASYNSWQHQPPPASNQQTHLLVFKYMYFTSDCFHSWKDNVIENLQLFWQKFRSFGQRQCIDYTSQSFKVSELVSTPESFVSELPSALQSFVPSVVSTLICLKREGEKLFLRRSRKKQGMPQVMRIGVVKLVLSKMLIFFWNWCIQIFCSQCRISREQWRMSLYLYFWRCTRFIGIFIDSLQHSQRRWRAAVAENMNFPGFRARFAKYWEIVGKIYFIGHCNLTNSLQPRTYILRRHHLSMKWN